MPTIGIDLGTSTSEIAFINENGVPQLIPNHLGEYITPSVIHITENSSPIIGLEAKEKLLTDPENTFMEVKRLLGTGKTLSYKDKNYSPSELSSFILKYLVECAEKHLNQTIKEVVITVPAYFTDAQRKETIKAGEMAGLTVSRIINEPTAASLDYGLENMDKCQNILVYDFGGGTLDVTVMELFEGVIDVKSSCGNNALGGKDIDQKLIDYIVNKIKDKYKLDITKDLRAMMRIKRIAEECKIALSNSGVFYIDLPFLVNKNGKAIGFSETITREFFEGLISDLVYSTGEQIKHALFDADLKTTDLDLVLLVGGTTRIPLVSKFIKETFLIEPKELIDPDLSVVRGASIQAGIIQGIFEKTKNEIVIADVCPYSLSLEVLDHNDFGFNTTFCDILIERNTTIPVSTTKIYSTSYDYQTKVNISTYQGESRNPKENVLLNNFTLSGLPSLKAQKEKVKVTFTYDLNGILNVEAESVSNGKKVSVQIDTNQILSDSDLEQWNKAKNAKRYKSIIKKAESFIENRKNSSLEDFDVTDFDSDDLDDIEVTNDLKNLIRQLKSGLINQLDTELLDNMKDEIMELLYYFED